MSKLPQRGDIVLTPLGPMAFSQWIGLAVANSLRTRGIWRDGDDSTVVIERLRDMAAVSTAVIDAMYEWVELVENQDNE